MVVGGLAEDDALANATGEAAGVERRRVLRTPGAAIGAEAAYGYSSYLPAAAAAWLLAHVTMIIALFCLLRVQAARTKEARLLRSAGDVISESGEKIEVALNRQNRLSRSRLSKGRSLRALPRQCGARRPSASSGLEAVPLPAPKSTVASAAAPAAYQA